MKAEPINFAPLDGTEILGWRKDSGWMIVKWTCLDEFLTESERESGQISEEEAFEEGWYYADFMAGGLLEGDLIPTHWLPLPEDPE